MNEIKLFYILLYLSILAILSRRPRKITKDFEKNMRGTMIGGVISILGLLLFLIGDTDVYIGIGFTSFIIGGAVFLASMNESARVLIKRFY